MSEVVEESYNTITRESQNYSTALKFRLDMTAIIEDIEMFLNGEVIQIDEEGKAKRVRKGKAKANPDGIHSLLYRIRAVLNNAVVQGNFAVDKAGYSEEYEKYIYMMRTSLTKEILLNLYKWEIDEREVEFLVDTIMSTVKPFMTRLIGNKERDSYANTIQTQERTVVGQQNQGIKLFNK